jgi:hypothetical protein
VTVGSSYAASSATRHTIKACAAKKGGALRLATRCKSSERAVTWNSVGPRGPAGPGASLLTYNGTPTASVIFHKVGTIGPWTLFGTCVNNGGTIYSTMTYTGPAVTQDMTLNGVRHGTGAYQVTNVTSTHHPAVSATADAIGIGQGSSDSTGSTSNSATVTWISKTASYSQTMVATATSIAAGDDADSCHWSSVAVPLKG